MSSPKTLTLYKKLLRLGRSWIAQNHPSQTQIERTYILDETRSLFRANKDLSDPNEIKKYVLEAEARLTMAEHYKNPYPRPVNFPKGLYTKKQGKALGKAMFKKSQASRPIYVKSLE
uniref:LYR motif-containing protein 1 n=1 Tax=Caligus clemensi TaxID=344056 RepID=C1C0Z2_CALCM|nr:LYR motif-containing protein 1 [Caligus clemensi]